VQQARGALHQRLAHRFLFRPEVEFPLVEADKPARRREGDASAADTTDSPAAPVPTARTLARREGGSR
jgi:hypothetical protein